MKLILKVLILSILSLMAVPGISQVQSQFQGTINVFASSEISAYRYSITGFFNDLNGKYTSDQLLDGDVLYAIEGADCIRFTVDSILTNMGGIITAYVRDVDSVSTVPPSGISALMREGPNRQYPTYIPGISVNLQSCILSHFALEVDEDLANVAASGVTITQVNHGFSLWQPIYWQDTLYAIPPQDTNIALYVVVDSIDANTFKAASYGSFATDLPEGIYYQNGGTYSLTADTVQTPLFVVANGELVINGFTGFDVSPGTDVWLKTELEAGTPVSIAADTTTFDITGLERARFIANRVGDYTYSSRMYNTNTPNAGMYVTNSRNGTVNRVEVDTFKTRLVAYSTTASTELAFYQDSMTLAMTSDTPQVGQVLGVHSIAYDGITANLKYQDRGWTNYQTTKAILGADSSFVHDPAVDTTLIKGTARLRDGRFEFISTSAETYPVTIKSNAFDGIDFQYDNGANTVTGTSFAGLQFRPRYNGGISGETSVIEAQYYGNGLTRHGGLIIKNHNSSGLLQTARFGTTVGGGIAETKVFSSFLIDNPSETEVSFSHISGNTDSTYIKGKIRLSSIPSGTVKSLLAITTDSIIITTSDTLITFGVEDYNIGTLLATNPQRFNKITCLASVPSGAASDAQLLLGTPGSTVAGIEIVLWPNDADGTQNVVISGGTNEIAIGNGTYTNTVTATPGQKLTIRAMQDPLAANAWKWFVI